MTFSGGAELGAWTPDRGAEPFDAAITIVDDLLRSVRATLDLERDHLGRLSEEDPPAGHRAGAGPQPGGARTEPEAEPERKAPHHPLARPARRAALPARRDTLLVAVDARTATDLQHWSTHLGVPLGQLIDDALSRHLEHLAGADGSAPATRRFDA